MKTPSNYDQLREEYGKDLENLLRCAGYVRQHGWEEDEHGMAVLLYGPVFCTELYPRDALGYYSKEYIEEFMRKCEEGSKQ